MAFPFDVLSWLVRLRYKITPPAAADGETVELQGDVHGRILARVEATGPSGATPARQLAPARHGLLKAAPGSLLEVSLWNNGESALWFQVHDKASAPGNGDTCVDQVMLPAGGAIGWRPMVPVACATQVRWAASTTPGTLTLPGSDTLGFSAAVL
jgi:hypothetical protein